MISINIYEIIMQILNFVILLWLLNRFLIKPLLKYLDKRQDTIQKDLEETEQNKLKSEKILSEQKQLLQQANDDAREIRRKAEEIAQKERELLMTDSRQEADMLIETAKKEIEHEVDAAKKALKDEIGTIAISLSEEIMRKNLDAETQQDIIRNYLKNMEN